MSANQPASLGAAAGRPNRASVQIDWSRLSTLATVLVVIGLIGVVGDLFPQFSVGQGVDAVFRLLIVCLLYTSPSPRDCS